MQKLKKILLLLGVCIFAGCGPGARPLPAVGFSPAAPASWTLENDNPITSLSGKVIGSQLLLRNDDRKRTLLVRVCNASDDLKSNAEEWKQCELNSWLKSGTQIQKQEFGYETSGGKDVAQLQLEFLKTGETFYLAGQSWMQGQIFVTCEAMGQGIEVANDTEIAGLISSVTVK
jgi:hypothetical protein